VATSDILTKFSRKVELFQRSQRTNSPYKYLSDGHEIFLLAEVVCKPWLCTGHQLCHVEFVFQSVLAQLDLWKNRDTYKVALYVLSKKLDEK